MLASDLIPLIPSTTILINVKGVNYRIDTLCISPISKTVNLTYKLLDEHETSETMTYTMIILSSIKHFRLLIDNKKSYLIADNETKTTTLYPLK